MKQIFQTEIEQEPSLERSVGNLFADKLDEKNLLNRFDELSAKYLVSIDIGDGKGFAVLRSVGGFPAKVKEILKMVILPTHKLQFNRYNAGG